MRRIFVAAKWNNPALLRGRPGVQKDFDQRAVLQIETGATKRSATAAAERRIRAQRRSRTKCSQSAADNLTRFSL